MFLTREIVDSRRCRFTIRNIYIPSIIITAELLFQTHLGEPPAYPHGLEAPTAPYTHW